ncbi:hypothetical protein DDZ14_14080 [Maritimibacter sp. 55A14]|uniref:L,D-transpeptidase n=1 Tax=Maritimibacter sp. 55A14 TaxID=2174844 RepID=UPI000D61FC70|nr:L,D-transpeptidase [Maritimibacter sp. 55A14]PWE31202.1 hypothetical protein DDZ14_14080 [Maritimibacter sp. 55A14]
MTQRRFDRRGMLVTGAAMLGSLASPALAQGLPGDTPPVTVRRNASSFRTLVWQDHFETLEGGAILADTTSRAVHYWSEDESIYRLYPSSVPMSEDLTRRGLTRVVRKVVGPTWRPTPSMKERDPSLPDVVGPGPDNPLGSHALYLAWQFYRVHGTHDTRKIGRRSSSGCIGLYNEDIAELFEMAEVGTQVRLV